MQDGPPHSGLKDRAGEGCTRLSLAPALLGSRRAHPGMHWDPQHGPRAVAGHTGCAAWGQCPTAGRWVDFYPLPRGEPSSLWIRSLLQPCLFFPVKFRVVSLDKDFAPSNEKVRAGLGKGRGDGPPLHCPPTILASHGRGVGPASAFPPRRNPAPASPAWVAALPRSRDAPCSSRRLRKRKQHCLCDRGTYPLKLSVREVVMVSGRQRTCC